MLKENDFVFKLVDGTVRCITTAITGRKMALIFTAEAPIKRSDLAVMLRTAK